MADPIETPQESIYSVNKRLIEQISNLQKQINELKESNGDLNVDILILKAKIKELTEA
jgi:peptidoglycan hydrolase CwlO-like protein